jgi:transposase
LIFIPICFISGGEGSLAKGDKAFVGKGRVTPEEAEIKGLRKQLEKVKEERDILKKALAVFSKQNS